MAEKTVGKEFLALHESFTDEEYDNSKCLSYSILKDVLDNPEILIEGRKRVEAEWLTFGTLVDLILTGSPGELDKKVFINDSVPSEQFKNIAEYIVNNNLDINTLTDDKVNEVYVQSGSGVNWLVPTKRKKMMEECTSYVDLLTKHAGQIIVDTSMFNEATKIAEVFMTHRWSKGLFMPPKEQYKLGLDIYYQYKIKYIYEEIQCKSKIDVLVVDHKNRLIIPFDLKTGSDTPRQFIKSAFYKYRYCYQSTLYKEGLVLFLSKFPEFKDYLVSDFRFVYVSRLKPTYPIIMRIDPVLHRTIKNTGVSNTLYELPALDEIMEAVQSYMNRIDEGETVLEPYDFFTSDGEVVLTTDIPTYYC